MIDENTKTIFLTWCAEDVIHRDEIMTEEISELTTDDAWLILKSVYNNHECNVGVNWDVIEDEIEQYKYKKLKDTK